MKVQELTISRTPSYETPANTLVGTVRLTGENGSMTLTLSPATLGRIFQLCIDEATATARANAAEVPRAMKDAVHERLTLEMTS